MTEQIFLRINLILSYTLNIHSKYLAIHQVNELLQRFYISIPKILFPIFTKEKNKILSSH